MYLFGTKAILPYRLVFIAMTLVGCFMKLDAIWALADILNGLMAFPNLIALLCLSGAAAEELQKFIHYRKTGVDLNAVSVKDEEQVLVAEERPLKK